MTYLLLSITLMVCLFAGISKKYLGDKFEHKSAMYFMYGIIASLMGAFTLVVLSGSFAMSSFTFWLGILFGAITGLSSVSNLMALEHGPFAYTMVLISLSSVIPALSGSVIWNETIAPVQIVGILLMIICIFCSVDSSGDQKKSSIIWLLYVSIAFITSGSIGVMQKWHQNSPFKDERDVLLVLAFIVATFFSIGGFLVYRPKKLSNIKIDLKPSYIVIMAVAGVCTALNHKINLYLSGVMDSAVFFPVVNGGGLVLSTISAFLLFKEKLSLKKKIGVVIGIVAVVLLCNPF